MVKGYRDIKTIGAMSRQKPQSSVLKSSKNCTTLPKLQKGGLSLAGMGKKRDCQAGNLQNSIKTWVFTRKPKLVRVQKLLCVDMIEEPNVDVFGKSMTKHDKGHSNNSNGINKITVIAQMPGVRKKNVQVDVKGDILILEANVYIGRKLLKYFKEIVLPFEVKPLYTNCTLKHGIFQIDFEEKDR